MDFVRLGNTREQRCFRAMIRWEGSDGFRSLSRSLSHYCSSSFVFSFSIYFLPIHIRFSFIYVDTGWPTFDTLLSLHLHLFLSLHHLFHFCSFFIALSFRTSSLLTTAFLSLFTPFNFFGCSCSVRHHGSFLSLYIPFAFIPSGALQSNLFFFFFSTSNGAQRT